MIGRFTTVDPMAEASRRWSTYSYGGDNPIRFIDVDGLFFAPGDLFKTQRQAARDFGKTYNDNSIREGQEYGSTIYRVVKNGKTFYSYNEANTGGNASVSPNALIPAGTEATADIHSHGKYEERYLNNEFSRADKNDNNKSGLMGYLTTPNGSLKEYDPKTKSESVVSTDLPSDPKDPDRKNNIIPLENPIPLEGVSEMKPADIFTKQDNVRVVPSTIKPKREPQ